MTVNNGPRCDITVTEVRQGHAPAEQTRLCAEVDCETVYYGYPCCPVCGSKAFMPLTKITGTVK
jgi:hypothetical protein